MKKLLLILGLLAWIGEARAQTVDITPPTGTTALSFTTFGTSTKGMMTRPATVAVFQNNLVALDLSGVTDPNATITSFVAKGNVPGPVGSGFTANLQVVSSLVMTVNDLRAGAAALNMNGISINALGSFNYQATGPGKMIKGELVTPIIWSGGFTKSLIPTGATLYSFSVPAGGVTEDTSHVYLHGFVLPAGVKYFAWDAPASGGKVIWPGNAVGLPADYFGRYLTGTPPMNGSSFTVSETGNFSETTFLVAVQMFGPVGTPTPTPTATATATPTPTATPSPTPTATPTATPTSTPTPSPTATATATPTPTPTATATPSPTATPTPTATATATPTPTATATPTPIPINKIGDRVFFDVNGNGLQDPEDIGVDGIRMVLLTYPDGIEVGEINSEGGGLYHIPLLDMIGVRAAVDMTTIPGGLVISGYKALKNGVHNNAIDSDFHPETGLTEPFMLIGLGNNFDIDLGLKLAATPTPTPTPTATATPTPTPSPTATATPTPTATPIPLKVKIITGDKIMNLEENAPRSDCQPASYAELNMIKIFNDSGPGGPSINDQNFGLAVTGLSDLFVQPGAMPVHFPKGTSIPPGGTAVISGPAIAASGQVPPGDGIARLTLLGVGEFGNPVSDPTLFSIKIKADRINSSFVKTPFVTIPAGNNRFFGLTEWGNDGTTVWLSGSTETNEGYRLVITNDPKGMGTDFTYPIPSGKVVWPDESTSITLGLNTINAIPGDTITFRWSECGKLFGDPLTITVVEADGTAPCGEFKGSDLPPEIPMGKTLTYHVQFLNPLGSGTTWYPPTEDNSGVAMYARIVTDQGELPDGKSFNVGQLVDASVSPGEIGTFEFTTNTPLTTWVSEIRFWTAWQFVQNKIKTGVAVCPDSAEDMFFGPPSAVKPYWQQYD